MKYLFIWFFGVVLGAAAAAAVLYYNPLTSEAGRVRPGDAMSFAYRVPEPSVLALSHAEQLGLPRIPNDMPLLWESGIEGVVLGVANLAADDGGTEAVASRIGVPSTRTNLLLEGVLSDDYWLVTVPGQGSLFVESESNYWPLFKDAIIPVGFLKRSWGGPKEYRPTQGPGPGRSGEIVGATGRFAGRTGIAAESLTLERYSAERGIESLSGTLSIALDDVRVAD